MNSEQFAHIFEKQVEKCREVLLGKAVEYATDDDRLHNFTAAAPFVGQTPQQVLGGYMLKHTMSIYDMIGDDHDPGDLEKWDEKITDHINYLILLKALLAEAREDLAQTVIDFTTNPIPEPGLPGMRSERYI